MSYFLGYMMGLQDRLPRQETFRHRVALLKDRVRRYIKNWRYHLLRQKKPLSPEALISIQELIKGYEDGLAEVN